MKVCSRCKQEKEISTFYFERKNKDGHASVCKVCSDERRKEHRKKNPRKYGLSFFKWYLQHYYNISYEKYEEKLKEQGGRCAICGSYATQNKKHKRFSLDHCHKTNTIRGLLCDRCNVGLGRFQDSSQVLQNAIDYLRRWENK